MNQFTLFLLIHTVVLVFSDPTTGLPPDYISNPSSNPSSSKTISDDRTIHHLSNEHNNKEVNEKALRTPTLNRSLIAHRDLGVCGAGQKHIATDLTAKKSSGGADLQEDTSDAAKVGKRRLGTCSACVSGQYQNEAGHTFASCKTCGVLCVAGETETTACTLTTGPRVCTSNICSCSNGVKATGTACTTHNTNMCTSCSSGYTKSGNVCNANTCGSTQVANSNKAATASITGMLLNFS